MKNKVEIASEKGKLGILLMGMGAVATTFVAGVISIRKGLGLPVGSMTQMGRIRIGTRIEKNFPWVRDFVPLASLDSLVFGGWDIFSDNAYEAAMKAGVLEKSLLESIKPELEKIRPMAAVFNQKFVKKLNGPNKKEAATLMDYVAMLEKDIATFKAENQVDRVVMVWCGSTEVYIEPEKVPDSLAAFEEGLHTNHPWITPSMIYAYTALKLGIPFANGAPNLSVDLPALQELAAKTKTPICGKDFKTGQTLMKTILAPGFKARQLGLTGWFSTNILGNRDGEVLEDPGSFKSKEVSKLSVLEHIFQPELYPDLYGNYYHQVRINYYPPRGDNKEGWDNIDIFGWLGYPMQIKVDFLCKDSILAAPLVLDLALFMDFAKRSGLSGIQEWLSFYFKSPMTLPTLYPEHDLFVQLAKLKNTLRYLMGEEVITHLGADYYDF